SRSHPVSSQSSRPPIPCPLPLHAALPIYSHTTKARIRSFFGREAQVVYPPVETGRFSPGTVRGHYALVSELMPHKRIDVAIEALDRKSTRLNSSHRTISYAVFCLKKKRNN